MDAPRTAGCGLRMWPYQFRNLDPQLPAVMTKITFYSVLFTLFLWLGGIVSYGPITSVSREASAAGTTPAVSVQAATDDAVESQVSEAAGPEAEEPANLLGWQPATFIWELILFVILLAVLAKFVWPPILNGLQQREAKIRGDLEQAEQARNQAGTTLDEYKKQLAQAQKQAQQIIEQSRGDARKVADQLREQAQADLTQMRKRAEADIHAAKEQAVADIYDQAAGLATQVAGQILQREIRPEDHQTLVRRSLSGLESVAN